jgi:hypothetical protein
MTGSNGTAPLGVITYGSAAQALIDRAFENFVQPAFATLSFCTTPVELLALDGSQLVVTHGTGFFWRLGEQDFVITNWHVLSGRNVFTGELLDATNAFIPRIIRVWGWRMISKGQQIEWIRSFWTVDMGQEGIDGFETPPIVGGYPLDIAAIPLPPGFVLTREPAGVASEKLSAIEPRVNIKSQDRIRTGAGDECMILGYPFKHYGGAGLPIWKRGSIATDTNMPIDGAPAFLVDAATSPAMSGAPVFRRATASAEVDRETQVVSEFRGYQFLGVYGGRLRSRELDQVNVGYAWFGSMVDQAIHHSACVWRQVQAAQMSARQS